MVDVIFQLFRVVEMDFEPNKRREVLSSVFADGESRFRRVGEGECAHRPGSDHVPTFIQLSFGGPAPGAWAAVFGYLRLKKNSALARLHPAS